MQHQRVGKENEYAASAGWERKTLTGFFMLFANCQVTSSTVRFNRILTAGQTFC
jgi:hypothetical protein